MLTRSVGTKLYASPEQLASSAYDYKSDIYSLGMIIQRLLVPTYTQMETIQMLEQLRQNKIRESVLDYFNILAPLLKRSIEADPKSRPDLEELEKALVLQEMHTFSLV